MQNYYRPFKISGRYKAAEIIPIFMDPIYIIGPCPIDTILAIISGRLNKLHGMYSGQCYFVSHILLSPFNPRLERNILS